jgi:hypothetical protein
MAFQFPSKLPILTRIYISSKQALDISWLRHSLNTYLQDAEIKRPIIGYIQRELVVYEDIRFLYMAEVLCGSDNLDDLLEHIQNSTSWIIPLTKTERVEIWEVPEGYGEYLLPYEYERDIHREKLMQKWAEEEPKGEKIVWIYWTRAQEAKYQAQLRSMKRTSEEKKMHYLLPDHFTEKTVQYMKQLRKRVPVL